MKSSCLIHPPKERFFTIGEHQCKFCNGNSCAAAIMSWLEYRHNGKLFIDAKNKRMNDIAEMHGDNRIFPEDTHINFTITEIIEDLHHTFGRNKVIDALKLLEELKIIKIHVNPNPKYRYDKSRYIRFYPDVYNQWILEQGLLGSIQTSGGRDNYPDAQSSDFESDDTQLVDNSDRLNLNDRDAEMQNPSFKIKPSIFQNESTPFKIKRYIKNINNNINNNQSINTHENFNNNSEKPILDKAGRDDIQLIVNALIAKGMPAKRFYPDALNELHCLKLLGASEAIFLQAYDIAYRCKQENSFGVNYLAKVIEDLLSQSKKQKINHRKTSSVVSEKQGNANKTTYENELTKGLHWIDGDE